MRSSLWAAGSMPSNSDSELSAAAADNVVAFEVDEAGGTWAPGWGVVVIGLAQEHADLCAVPRARGPGCVQHSDVPADPDVALAVTGHRSSPRAGWRPTCPPSSPGRSPPHGSCRSCLAAPRPAGTTHQPAGGASGPFVMEILLTAILVGVILAAGSTACATEVRAGASRDQEGLMPGARCWPSISGLVNRSKRLARKIQPEVAYSALTLSAYPSRQLPSTRPRRAISYGEKSRTLSRGVSADHPSRIHHWR